ncbi:hypothetical protein [Chryseobacterium sp. SIMBA_028]|uniref:hypothetical protein n=1 Tax=Chryseobacterium sp. SIMBA_028 TaxID=3085771 RepID=UPI00397ACC73
MINKFWFFSYSFVGFSEAAIFVQGFEASFEHVKVTPKKKLILAYKSVIFRSGVYTVGSRHLYYSRKISICTSMNDPSGFLKLSDVGDSIFIGITSSLDFMIHALPSP